MQRVRLEIRHWYDGGDSVTATPTSRYSECYIIKTDKKTDRSPQSLIKERKDDD